MQNKKLEAAILTIIRIARKDHFCQMNFKNEDQNCNSGMSFIANKFIAQRYILVLTICMCRICNGVIVNLSLYAFLNKTKHYKKYVALRGRKKSQTSERNSWQGFVIKNSNLPYKTKIQKDVF